MENLVGKKIEEKNDENKVVAVFTVTRQLGGAIRIESDSYCPKAKQVMLVDDVGDESGFYFWK